MAKENRDARRESQLWDDYRIAADKIEPKKRLMEWYWPWVGEVATTRRLAVNRRYTKNTTRISRGGNAPLARRVAEVRNFPSRDQMWEDFCGTGAIALSGCIDRFASGVFRAYAYPRIWGAMSDSLRKWQAVNPSRTDRLLVHQNKIQLKSVEPLGGKDFVTDNTLDAADDRDAFRSILSIAVLSRAERLTLTLLYVENMTHRESSRVVGCGESMSQLHRRNALCKLQKSMAAA